jgi:hypothetical protein
MLEILGSHGGEYDDDDNLLGYDAASIAKVDRRFRGMHCLHHQGERPDRPDNRDSMHP